VGKLSSAGPLVQMHHPHMPFHGVYSRALVGPSCREYPSVSSRLFRSCK
jgi:hypothetical protein